MYNVLFKDIQILIKENFAKKKLFQIKLFFFFFGYCFRRGLKNKTKNKVPDKI